VFVSETLNLLAALQSFVFSVWLTSMSLKLPNTIQNTACTSSFVSMLSTEYQCSEESIMPQDTLFCRLAALVAVWQHMPWFVVAWSGLAFHT
jgi:hypothetical protein